MPHSKNELKQLIAQNRLDEAVEILLKQINLYLEKNKNDKFVSKINDALLINSSKLNGLKRAESMGLLSAEEKKITQAEVTNAVLYIIDELPDAAVIKGATLRKGSTLWVAAIIVASLIGVYFVVKFVTDKDVPTEVAVNTDTTGTKPTVVPTDTTRGIINSDTLETAAPPTDKLTIDVWTDKGKKPVLTEGEIVKIYFRVNQPCYIRLIYKMADGSAVLLANNYEVKASKVNTQLSAPTVFGVGAPFGNELLFAYAQSEPFDKLKTQKQGKYDIILQPDFDKAKKTTERGLYKLDVFVKTEMKFVTKEK